VERAARGSLDCRNHRMKSNSTAEEKLEDLPGLQDPGRLVVRAKCEPASGRAGDALISLAAAIQCAEAE